MRPEEWGSSFSSELGSVVGRRLTKRDQRDVGGLELSNNIRSDMSGRRYGGISFMRRREGEIGGK